MAGKQLQQAQHRQRHDGVGVLGRAPDAQHLVQRALMFLGQLADVSQRRTQQLAQRRVRQPGLGLGTVRPQHQRLGFGGIAGNLVQQRRLAGAGATHIEQDGPTARGITEQPLREHQLGGAAQQERLPPDGSGHADSVLRRCCCHLRSQRLTPGYRHGARLPHQHRFISARLDAHSNYLRRYRLRDRSPTSSLFKRLRGTGTISQVVLGAIRARLVPAASTTGERSDEL